MTPQPDSRDRSEDKGSLRSGAQTLAEQFPRLQRLHEVCGDSATQAAFPQIYETLLKNKVTVIDRRACSGATLFLPAALAAMGNRVLCTEPTVLARTIPAHFLTSRLEEPLHREVGFPGGEHQALSEEGRRCPLLYCSDRIEAVRGLFELRQGTDYLIIDEVQEGTLRIQSLIAWAREKLLKRDPFRLVLLASAAEIQPVKQYFRRGGLRVGSVVLPPPPRPGRVERATEPLLTVLGRFKAQGEKGALVFVPGYQEGERLYRELAENFPTMHPQILSRRLTQGEQIQLLMPTEKFRVVISARPAEARVLGAGLSVVVDSGLAIEAATSGAVKFSSIVAVSDALHARRAEIVRHSATSVVIRCVPPPGTPLGLSTKVLPEGTYDSLVLRLAYEGLDARNVSLLNPVPRAELQAAFAKCFALKLLETDGADGRLRITTRGAFVLGLPTAVECGVMLFEARGVGLLPEMATIAGIIKVGGIAPHKNFNAAYQGLEDPQSQLLSQYALYCALDAGGASAADTYGANYQWFLGARSKRVELIHRLNIVDRSPQEFSPQQREQLLGCIVDGLAHSVYKRLKGARAVDAKERVYRLLGQGTGPVAEEFVVGFREDRSEVTPNGRVHVEQRLRLSSNVSAALLVERAPHLCVVDSKPSLQYWSREDRVRFVQRTKFGGYTIQVEELPIQPTQEEVIKTFAGWLARQSAIPKLARDSRTPEIWRTVAQMNHSRLKEIATACDGNVELSAIGKEAQDGLRGFFVAKLSAFASSDGPLNLSDFMSPWPEGLPRPPGV